MGNYWRYHEFHVTFGGPLLSEFCGTTEVIGYCTHVLTAEISGKEECCCATDDERHSIWVNLLSH